ncbi:MAG TPA: DNA polymerase IV [Thermomicrobiaceae bacterium]|nr:DNA polymerase IV [Thermomicrobiaceae bacterium]
MGQWQRVVVHADLDAFFAAAEILRHPELRGRPVIVGGQPGGRGVVASASYEARAHGVRSAMPAAQALRLCPGAVFLPGDGAYYRALSHRFRAILEEFSPLVEMVSVDEAYLDLSGAERALGAPPQAARAIKRRVRDELGLVVSLGVAANRLVAKIASDLDKPDGLRVVEPGTEAAVLAPLAVERLPGIGPKAAERLHAMGVTTLGGLSRLPVAVLAPLFGRRAAEVVERARGVDGRPVVADGEPAKSLGHERTLDQDLVDPAEIARLVERLAARTGRDLRREGQQGRVVAVKLRYADFTTVGRQRRLAQPTDDQREIARVAAALVEELLARHRAPVRLLGVRVAALGPAAIQLSLFGDDRLRRRELNRALDHLAERYGADLVRVHVPTGPAERAGAR